MFLTAGFPISSLSGGPPALTPQAQQLLQILREAEDWINRAELARRAGKAALNKWDMVLLEKLAQAGLIEVMQVPRQGLIAYEWRYRALKREVSA